MVTKISDLRIAGEVLLDRCYKQILSGEQKNLVQAKTLIKEIALLSDEAKADQILIDVGLWLNNHKTAKLENFLESIWTRSKALKGSSKWKIRARIARGARQAARFQFAQKHFTKALTKAASDPSADPQDVADVRAEYAESRVYLGYPGQIGDANTTGSEPGALAILSLIPQGNMLGWQHWIKAFAIHQDAFAKVSTFGSMVNTFDPPVGDPNDYTESIEAIDAALPYLNHNAQCDIELLRAANYGALVRVDNANGDDPTANQQAAANALAAFQADRDQGQPKYSGLNWSIHKEKRGRFYLRYRKAVDGPTAISQSQIQSWREAYREHFLNNLRVAGLQETSNKTDNDYKDGKNDSDEDYPGDDAP